MRKITALLAFGCLMLGLLQPAGAGPTAGGIASDNVEYVTFVPFEVGTATGARAVGNYLYVTSWKTFSIYDIEDPANPTLITTEPFGFAFENEDVGTNGKIMLFSESAPRNILHIWDVKDKANPTEIAQLTGAGDHTTDCILNCTWAYGSDGAISDLRDPANPKLMEESWGDGMPTSGGHDVTEIAPGIVLTSTNPMMLLDARKDPVHPKLLATSETMPAFVHSNLWPNKGKDDFAISTGETWVPGANARCTEQSAGISSWDGTHWKKTKSITLIDTYKMVNGTGADGNPPGANPTFGCSSHWFDTHPKFNDGGLVAAGFYNHGTRFIEVASNGKLKEIGYFYPYQGATSAAYWVTNDIVYAIDYQRGFDVLRYTGKV
jgi:hypothetical protein